MSLSRKHIIHKKAQSHNYQNIYCLNKIHILLTIVSYKRKRLKNHILLWCRFVKIVSCISVHTS